MRAARFLVVMIAPFRVGVHAVSLIVIACLAITTVPCPAAFIQSLGGLHENLQPLQGIGKNALIL